jgi:hypothetical protein
MCYLFVPLSQCLRKNAQPVSAAFRHYAVRFVDQKVKGACLLELPDQQIIAAMLLLHFRGFHRVTKGTGLKRFVWLSLFVLMRSMQHPGMDYPRYDKHPRPSL